MAVNEKTPVDQLIGMPLPIAPPEITSNDASPERDWHHHFHPRRSPLLEGVGGIAVRNSRIQLTNFKTHHIDYHGYYEGPDLPETEQAQFNVVVFAVAGYMPEEAIAFRRGEPRVINTTQKQRARMWGSGDIKVASKESLREFITKYTLSQSLDHVKEDLVDEFLHTKVDERRRYLGHLLLAQKIEKATEPLEFAYRSAWEKGLISPKLPIKPRNFVQSKLGPVPHRDRLLIKMGEKLAS